MEGLASRSATPASVVGSARRYRLRCLGSNTVLDDDADAPIPEIHLQAPTGDGAFLRAEYPTMQPSWGPLEDGVFRFRDWLPVVTELPGSGCPVTYHAEALGRHLGLSNLWVTFSGWWPERGARIPSGTFKECEAFAVYGRMGHAAQRETLVVASAGNTARAFLRVASAHHLPLVVVVPEANLPDLWTVGPRSDSTVVVAAGEDSDYSDAIRLAGMLCSQVGFRAEGGARNVARRDGMGTTFLSATEAVGRIPDHYFQAVGSGTGAIAAWEANRRLVSDGRFGGHLARLHLAQNAPFQVLVDSWAARSRELLLPGPAEALEQISRIDAKVLANRLPPWSPTGGLFDALSASDGAMYAVTNDEAASAGDLFERLEGIDLSPAARVACAALVRARAAGVLGDTEVVNLNVTGGGYRRAHAELDTLPLEADVVADRALFDPERIAAAVRDLQERRSA